MNPVPWGLETPQEFIAVSPALVDFMGGRIAHAAVWEKIRYRCSGPHAVTHHDGNWWPCSYADMARLTGMSVSACRTAITRLEQLGHIEARELKLGDPTDRTKAYRPVRAGGANAESDTGANAKSSKGLMPELAVDTFLIEELKTQEGASDHETEFEDWYRDYPKKSSKGAAKRAFATARKSVDLEVLTHGRDLYAAQCRMNGTEARYIKHASTWLNQECWDDDYGDVKITPSGFEAWFAAVLADVDTPEVERVLGLVFPMPDEIPLGATRAEFLAYSRAKWLTSVRPQAESRWLVQFGSLIAGP